MLDLSNQTLGKYEVTREIGRGNMGVVYLAHDPFSGRDVALKVALPESAHDSKGNNRYRKLFFNEAKIAGRLRHPNIISVHDAGMEGDICYIVMEYVDGGHTLHDHCQPENLLPLEDVVQIIFKCARALDYAHRNGVIHRDIKPRNILLTEEREAKISDFSIALRTYADATETQVRGYVGSPLYMSPEQVRDEGLTNQSDIFSVGVVMYELLTGKHPFAADNLPAIIHHITQSDPIPLPERRRDAPPILTQILHRTLLKNADERYKSGLDLATDLSQVFEHIKLLQEELSGREKFTLVRDLKLFQNFSESEIWEVVNASHWQDYEGEKRIIREGDDDNCFYVIVSGEVMVLKGDIEVDRLQMGDCFGEMGFIGGRERSASVVARTTTTVMVVRPSLIDRASLNCQLRFHRMFLTALVERLTRTTERVTT